MYTRRSTFPLKQNSSDQATEIAQKYGKIIHDLPGHVSTIMFVDGETLRSITTWDTQEHAEAVASTRDEAQRDLGAFSAGLRRRPSPLPPYTTWRDFSATRPPLSSAALPRGRRQVRPLEMPLLR